MHLHMDVCGNCHNLISTAKQWNESSVEGKVEELQCKDCSIDFFKNNDMVLAVPIDNTRGAISVGCCGI